MDCANLLDVPTEESRQRKNGEIRQRNYFSFVFHADTRKWTNAAVKKTLAKENPTQHKTIIATLLDARDPETNAGLSQERLVFDSTGFMYVSISNLFDF